MAIGIKDIAAACGLSTNSVSDILNCGREQLYRPETRERVLKAAAELNYRPNRTAQSMRSKQARAVGFLAYNMNSHGVLENPFVYPFVIGMSHYFTDQSYHVSMVEMKELQSGVEGTVPEVLRENYFDGLILHYGVPDSVREMLIRLKVPVIWWDAGVSEEYDCIYRDEITVASRLTRQLLDMGHRRIAFKVGLGWEPYLRGEPVHFSYKQRYEAYQSEMVEHGLEPLQIVGYEPDEIAAQIRDLKITAIVTMGSHELGNLMRPCLKLGLCIPDDISVASCDLEARRPQAQLNCGGITYDRYDAGQLAAAMLHSKIEDPNFPVPTECLLGEFQLGGTIAART